MTDFQDQDESPDSEAAASPNGAAGDRDRSGTRYPYYALDEAEKFVKAVQAAGGNEVLEDDLLKYLSLSRTTKSWIYKLSTAREFGLALRKGQRTDARITITDLGKRLALPGDENELLASRAAAFLTPSLYKKLFERYKGAPVPQPTLLANLLIREHKLVESVAEPAAQAFIASAKHAGLVGANNVLGVQQTGSVDTTNTDEKPVEDPGPPGQQVIRVPTEFIPHVFQLRRNLQITVALPPDLTKKDVNRLHNWLQTLPLDEDEDEGS